MNLNELNPDVDPLETSEWLAAIESVLEHEGAGRAQSLLERIIERTRGSGGYVPHSSKTAYVNTIAPREQIRSPGNHELEHRTPWLMPDFWQFPMVSMGLGPLMATQSLR